MQLPARCAASLDPRCSKRGKNIEGCGARHLDEGHYQDPFGFIQGASGLPVVLRPAAAHELPSVVIGSSSVSERQQQMTALLHSETLATCHDPLNCDADQWQADPETLRDTRGDHDARTTWHCNAERRGRASGTAQGDAPATP